VIRVRTGTIGLRPDLRFCREVIRNKVQTVQFLRPILLFTAGILALMVMQSPPSNAGSWKWDFEKDSASKPPTGFSFARTGSGRMGRWLVQAQKGTPSATKILAQLDTDATSYRFPVAVADSVSLSDLRLSVRCNAVSGKVDRACGLVFRYRDENNYYVVRANALENNVRLYYVKEGSASSSPVGTDRCSQIPGIRLPLKCEMIAFKFIGITRWSSKLVTEHLLKAEGWGFGQKRIRLPTSMI
jgi:hypothetical protein